jgi:hypothetical protein
MATMIQKSSVRESPRSVSQVLTGYNLAKYVDLTPFTAAMKLRQPLPFEAGRIFDQSPVEFDMHDGAPQFE